MTDGLDRVLEGLATGPLRQCAGKDASPAPVVTRMAPSPTGRMHAGNILAALVSWLIAKKNNGRVVLRIDDLDASRSRQSLAQQCMQDFELLGLYWDNEPLWQSARSDAYRLAFEHVAQAAHVYPCFCTRADLHAASAPHKGQGLAYPGTCRNLDLDESARRKKALAKQGRAPSFRVEVPQREIAVEDLFQGRRSFSIAQDCGDFILKRADGGYAYHLATVVDDAEQGVTLVARGFDLLSSTPQQIFLCDLLGFDAPTYAHVPLLMNREGRRLAKRDHDAGLDELLALLGSPEAVLGHTAFLAGIVTEPGPRSADELVEEADLDALSHVERIVWQAEPIEAS